MAISRTVARPSFFIPRRLRAGLVIALLLLVLAVVLVRLLQPPAADLAPDLTVAPAITPGQLTQVLARSTVAPNAVNLEITYAPPIYFQVMGQDAPADRALVFLLQEDTHIDALDQSPTRFSLQIDGWGDYPPTSGTILSDSGHHRLSRFLFTQADLPEAHESLKVIFHFANGASSDVTWALPLALAASSGAVSAAAATVDEARLPSLNATLRRVQTGVSYAGASNVEVAVTFATPEYFGAALPPEAANRFDPHQHAVFLVSETSHTADLPGATPPLELVYQGVTYQPDLVEQTVSSSHHRVALVRFSANPFDSTFLGKMDLSLPDGASMSWGLPVVYMHASAASPLGFTGAGILSLVGGMLAAMWPCLFQLTVFFIPALAGVSMQEASMGAGQAIWRFRVIKAALFFILGFTIVYTSAGALLGFAVQQFGSAPNFETWQRYIGIGAGFAIIVLAVRTAAKVRAPLVCKMPVLSRMAHGRKASSPLELMVAGLAFATGCMTCFGAALIIAMVVYVGMAGSALVGALTLFLFSMGMGIPLVIAAAAMSRVLPMLSRLERVMPWMGLASSAIMVGFAVMLITGNYMAFTNWLLEHV
jgi:cytochrome c-type biogenesis protein